MRLRALLAIVALVSLPALAQQTVTKAGTAASYAQGVQGVVNGVPIPTTITNSISVAGAADTVGADATFSANAVCAVVPMAGQPGSGFFLAAGTLAATLTPSISEDATPSGVSCSGGNYTPSKFVTDVNGNTATTLVLTNPNVFQHLGVATLAGTRCVKVCTTSYTSGSAVGHVTGTVALSPSPAPSADVTDRAGRLLGKVTGSDGSVLATANAGRLQVDVVTGGGGGGGSVTQGTNPWNVNQANSGTAGVTMLSAVVATGASTTYQNASGFTAHVLHVTATGTPNIVIRLEGSYDNSNWNTLSTMTQASASLNDLVASGWYPFLRANLTTFSGGSSPTLTAVYHGVDTSIASTQLPAALDANGFLKIHEQQTNPQFPAALSAGVNLRTTLQDWGTGGGAGGAAFTSATALDSTSAVTSASIAYAAALVSVNVSGSITSGSLNVECSNDAGTTYFACVGARASSGATDTVIALNGVTKEIWRVPFAGLSGFRVRLNPVITGAGTATVSVALSAVPSSAVVSAQSLPLPAGASTEATLALIKAKTDNLDVALSTRTKPADTQAISAATLPLPTGAAADATLTGGTAKSIVRGGAKGSTTAADVTSTANGTDHNALDVQLWLSGSALDPRSIRALTSSDTVTVVQGTGTNLHIVCDSGCSSSAGFADNAAFTVGTTAINPIGGLFDDTPPTAITTGKAAVARITNNRALHINLRNQAGTEIGTSGAPVRTDPTGTTTQPVSVVAGSAIIGKVAIDQTTPGTTNGVQVVAALPAGTNVIGHVIADSGSTTAVTQATASNLNAQVQGAGASGAAKAGNPVQSGAVFNTTQPTVTTGQTVENQATARGALVVATGVDAFAVTTTPPANASTNVTQFGSTNVSTGTGAGGAGIPRVTVSNDSTIGLVAGGAIVGKVGIDQTTPGTTNLVSAGQNGSWTVGQSGSWTVDISDRAARLLGVVYGSQGQQLKQTATNFNLQSELAVGGTLIDPRSIRLLTSSDVVDVSDRTARVLGHVICDSGCTPGGSFSDNTAFTGGTTAISVDGGEFNDTPLPDVTSGNAASVRITKQRAFHVNLRDSAGNEVTSLGSSGQITDGTFGAAKAAVLPQGQRADNTDPPLVVTLAPSSNPLPMTLTLQGQPTTTKGASPTFNILSKIQMIDEHGHMANVKGPAQPPTVYDPAQVVAVSPTPAPICPFTAALSQTANTIVVPGLASKTTYICKVFVVSTTAQSVSVTEGTGTTCGTGAAALAGSTTVANGMPLAANGGWVEGNGAAVVYTAKKIGDDVCLLQSGAGLVAGSVSYTYF